jgi:hypothetical protein
MGACPMNSRTGSISRRIVAAQPTIANARIKSCVATNEDVPDTHALWPLKDNGSESDIVVKFLIGTFGP